MISRGRLLPVFACLLAVAEVATAEVRLRVAADGSADFRTVQEAVMAVPAGTAAAPVVILLAPGTYREVVYVQREKRFFRLLGEDPERTRVTFDLHARLAGLDGKSLGTFRTPTVTIDADDFEAEGVTFENAAGPGAQALAVRVDGDRVWFRRCRFLGWQDTVFLNRGRQLFTECTVEGHVDVIFGRATAYFERCRLVARGDGYLTAPSTPEEARYGFVFVDCAIEGVGPEVRTYLGRPWRDTGAALFLRTRMAAVVRSEGSHNWALPHRERTARFAEAGSVGPGANPGARAPWARALSEEAAAAVTPEAVLGSWTVGGDLSAVPST